MKWRVLFPKEELTVDAVLLTSRENKYYTGGPLSGSGYVLLCRDETYIIVDGRYYTDMKSKNQEDIVLLMDQQHPFSVIMQELITKHKIRSVAVEDTMELATFQKLKQSLSVTIEIMNFQGLRAVKSAAEQKEIKDACKIAVETYHHMLSFIKLGMREVDVAIELDYFMKKHGAEKESFDTIVLSGIRGALPHGKPSEKKIEPGDFITMDFGAIYHHYCSDITRTFQVGKAENPKLRKIYDVVLEAQKDAIKQIRPGKRCQEIDAIAREIISQYGYGDYFLHNLGHSMGLLCHEDPRFSPSALEELRPGMVLTVEPGIYIEGLGGVRIEDDILVTETGCEVLTQAAEKEFIIVEG